jgi:osmoprotectant transport system ATP-binding protein
MRLQAELHKTIVFVTHDFDEAVKLGDRIAVLGDQSKILQYDTPEAVLANPADDTVAGFVGAGASLKQLTLRRVRDVPLSKAITASVDDEPADVGRKLVEAGGKFALLLDTRQRPVSWVHVREPHIRREIRDSVSNESTLQDALEAILTEGGDAVVTGNRGEYVGLVQIDTVMSVVRQLREDHAEADA